jgi:hypothetical protein
LNVGRRGSTDARLQTAPGFRQRTVSGSAGFQGAPGMRE